MNVDKTAAIRTKLDYKNMSFVRFPMNFGLTLIKGEMAKSRKQIAWGRSIAVGTGRASEVRARNLLREAVTEPAEALAIAPFPAHFNIECLRQKSLAILATRGGSSNIG